MILRAVTAEIQELIVVKICSGLQLTWLLLSVSEECVRESFVPYSYAFHGAKICKIDLECKLNV